MKILKVKCLAPTRLDNYLMQQFPALNPGRLNKALRENKIKLNGKKQPLSTRVMAGDEIKLFILDEVLDADKRVEGPAWKNARGPAQVIYDCPQILVVNKPAGLAVDGPEDDTLSTVLCSTSTSRASTRRTICTPRPSATGWTPAPAAWSSLPRPRGRAAVP